MTAGRGRTGLLIPSPYIHPGVAPGCGAAAASLEALLTRKLRTRTLTHDMRWVAIALGVLVGLAWLVVRASTERVPSRARPRRAPPTPPDTPDVADAPQPFGYKMCWLAVPSEEPDSVAAALGLEHAYPSNWERGLAAAFEGPDVVFVTPPVRGHVLAISPGLPAFGDETRGNDDALTFLRDLGKLLPAFFYFGTHRVVEYHAWSAIKGGEVVRAYGYSGERDETLIDLGALTPEEIEHGLSFSDASDGGSEDPRLDCPGEADVMRAAQAWSLDPTTLKDEPISSRLGILGIRQ